MMGSSAPDVITNDVLAGATSNLWLKLTQGGGTFRVYYSLNGTTWTFIPSFAASDECHEDRCVRRERRR